MLPNNVLEHVDAEFLPERFKAVLESQDAMRLVADVFKGIAHAAHEVDVVLDQENARHTRATI